MQKFLPYIGFVSLCWSCAPEPGELAVTDDGLAAFGELAFVGHGVMFDAEGRKLELDRARILELQEQAKARLSGRAGEEQRRGFDEEERRIRQTLGERDEGELNAIVLDQLIQALRPEDETKLRIFNNFLRTRLRMEDGTFETTTAGLATSNSGAAYLAECAANGVPTPPDWGSPLWVRQNQAGEPNGALNPSFLGGETIVYTFESTSPAGICVALPRIDGSSIYLLGIICQGTTTAKACFWDNQNNEQQFSIQVGQNVPIANFAGGKELEFGSGGRCTGCHIGENAFIVHPGTSLDLGAAGLPNNFVQPLVGASWPQNPGPSNVLDSVAVRPNEKACTTCHNKTRKLRFPVLWNQLEYCAVVLPNAFPSTMPPSGFEGDYTRHVFALIQACASPLRDGDGDGVIDQLDNCIPEANANQVDMDNNGVGDVCEDADGDTIVNSRDNCPNTPNPNQENWNNDDIGDHCADFDADGYLDLVDNCRAYPNPDQANNDGDDFGDLCDVDDDDDGVCYPGGPFPWPQSGEPAGGCDLRWDNCPRIPNRDQADLDGDLTGDACDSCPLHADTGIDTNGDGRDNACDPDDDGDGILDEVDNCPAIKNPAQYDFNGNGIGAACDPAEQIHVGPTAEQLSGYLRFRDEQLERYQVLIIPDFESIRGRIPRHPWISIEVDFELDVPMVITDGRGLTIEPLRDGDHRKQFSFELPKDLFDISGEISFESRLVLELQPRNLVELGRDYRMEVAVSPWSEGRPRPSR